MKIKSHFAVLVSLGILLSAAFSAIAQTGVNVPKSTSKINVKYDKGKDLTTVTMKSMTITRLDQEKKAAGTPDIPLHQMDIEGSFSYSGQVPTGPTREVMLRFHSVAGNYVFLRPQDVVVAIDRDDPMKGRGFSLGSTKYRSLAPKFNTVFEEFFDIEIPEDALRKFAAAGSLELYLGPVAYKLTAKQIDIFREWEKFLPQAVN